MEIAQGRVQRQLGTRKGGFLRSKRKGLCNRRDLLPPLGFKCGLTVIKQMQKRIFFYLSPQRGRQRGKNSIFPLFTKHRHKKPFTARCTRDETIHGLIPPRKQTFRNLPLRADGYCQKFCAQFLGNPADIFFIFVRIKGTGAVNQQAAVFEARPNITQNLPLPLCTKIYILRAPLADSSRVPTEKPFSGTRDIC